MANARSNTGSISPNRGASWPVLHSLVGQPSSCIRAKATSPILAYQADSQLCQVKSARQTATTNPTAHGSQAGQRGPGAAANDLGPVSSTRGSVKASPPTARPAGINQASATPLASRGPSP